MFFFDLQSNHVAIGTRVLLLGSPRQGGVVFLRRHPGHGFRHHLLADGDASDTSKSPRKPPKTYKKHQKQTEKMRLLP